MREDKDKIRQDKTRRDEMRQAKTRQDKTRQEKTRQDKRRTTFCLETFNPLVCIRLQDKTRQGQGQYETRQDMLHFCIVSGSTTCLPRQVKDKATQDKLLVRVIEIV